MRMVDADALYDKLEERYKFSSGQAHKAYGIAIDDVCDAPTIYFPSLVRRGRWIEIPDHYGVDKHLQCSVCKEKRWFKYNSEEKNGSKYCPNCWAYMGGGKEKMNAREMIRYAIENGYNTVKFLLMKDGRIMAAGQFLDAYYEFVKIPRIGDGFVTIRQLEDVLGADIQFEVISDDDFVTYRRVEDILGGKTGRDTDMRGKVE